MSALDPSAVRDFFAEFDQAHLDVWGINLDASKSWLDTVKKKATLKRFFEAEPGDVVEMLSRSRKADDAWYAKHGARTVGPRVIHAVQPVTVGGAPMAFVYTDAFEKNELGMNERFAVEDAGGALRIAARQVRCGECGGTGCAVCKQQGWRFAGGRELPAPKPVGNALKLIAPEHEGTKALYDALS